MVLLYILWRWSAGHTAGIVRLKGKDQRHMTVKSPSPALAHSPAAAVPETAGVQARHVVWLLALGLIWGSSYLFIKLLVEVVSPTVMIAVRFALGVVTLSVILMVRGGRLPRWGRNWGYLLIMSIFGNVVPFLLIAW